MKTNPTESPAHYLSNGIFPRPLQLGQRTIGAFEDWGVTPTVLQRRR